MQLFHAEHYNQGSANNISHEFTVSDSLALTYLMVLIGVVGLCLPARNVLAG
jgi:hypothetical protein